MLADVLILWREDVGIDAEMRFGEYLKCEFLALLMDGHGIVRICELFLVCGRGGRLL